MRFLPGLERSGRISRAPSQNFLLRAAWGLAAGLVACASLQASVYVRQLKLDALCKNAHRIVRGTVESATPGQVAAGGGSLPTVTYRIKVAETIAGVPAEIVNLTMVAEPKSRIRSGSAERAPIVEIPELTEGQEYLLFTTKPSKLGLSSPVGLAQGCFKITKVGDKEMAVNGVNNAGLGVGSGGPVAYAELAQRIRALRPN